MSKPIASHASRVLDGFTARVERDALHSIVGRLPGWVVPDFLTLIGVLGAAVCCFGLAASNFHIGFLWLALAGLFVNWFGDSLDGTLARARKIERPRYGFFVDHVSDLLSQVLISVGLGLSPFMHFDIACLALIAYLVLSVFTLVRLHVLRQMRLSFFGIGPTEMRLLIGAGIVAAAAGDPQGLMMPIAFGWTMFDWTGLGIISFAVTSLGIVFFRDARQLSHLDPVRHHPVEIEMIQISQTSQDAGIRARPVAERVERREARSIGSRAGVSDAGPADGTVSSIIEAARHVRSSERTGGSA